VARDLVPLSAAPKKTELARWLDSVEECAGLRCPNLADRVAAAALPGRVLIPLLVDRLRKVAAGSENPPTATLLGALMRRISELEPIKTGIEVQGLRLAAIAFHDAIAPLLTPHSRCVYPLLCPACQMSEPCPLDTWRLELGPLLLVGNKDKTRASNWLPTTGERLGRGGTYGQMRSGGRLALADAGMREALRLLHKDGQFDTANLAVGSAFAFGCLDPVVTEVYAIALSAGGRRADLEAGLAVCDKVLPQLDAATTDPGVLGLVVRSRSPVG
jgi:hypothetical protein